jgi:hypothetical protein
MSPTAVYATNVIVSAAIKPGSIPALLVALATEHKVTGNKRHFPLPEFEGTQIVSPAEFVRIVMEQARQEKED